MIDLLFAKKFGMIKKMKYVELTVRTNTAGSELVSEILWEYTTEGVSIDDVNDVLELDRMKKGTWDYVDDALLSRVGEDVLVRGYLPIDDKNALNEVKERIKNIPSFVDFPVGSLSVSEKVVDGDEWAEKWKESFSPIPIGKHFVVCPEWMDYEKKDGDVVILLDSNMAFGTGSHETTAMCLERIEKYVKAGDVVFDVGCGSGILGIGAALIGADSVLMTDIDECAVDAARENAARNHVLNVHVDLKNLLDGESGTCDLLVSNIMAEVLIGFCQGVYKSVKKGGKVILSGIVAEKADDVKRAYEAVGFTQVEQETRGEWCAEVFTKE